MDEHLTAQAARASQADIETVSKVPLNLPLLPGNTVS